MLLEGIEQNCPIQNQYSVFKAMRKVAQNLLIDDEKYRTLYADNDMVQKKILGRVGGYEFLRGVGFKQGADENELICKNPDRTIVNACIGALSIKIQHLKTTKSQWDPKYKQRKSSKAKGNNYNGGGKSAAQLQQEEQRMIEQAIRESQEQHVKDMLNRQNKALNQAKASKQNQQNQPIYHPNQHQNNSNYNPLLPDNPSNASSYLGGGNYGADFTNQKSVNMYNPSQEDDHKAEEL